MRLNRDRLKGVEGAADWADSLSTLFYVLLTLCKTMAPLTPFIVEHMFQNLKKLAKEDERVDSVHYLMLPVPNEAAYNPAIEKVRDETLKKHEKRSLPALPALPLPPRAPAPPARRRRDCRAPGTRNRGG